MTLPWWTNVRWSTTSTTTSMRTWRMRTVTSVASFSRASLSHYFYVRALHRHKHAAATLRGCGGPWSPLAPACTRRDD
jgi:hypothetical protein